MDVLTRHNVNIFGKGEKAMIFAHGYGCDQHMWRFITPAFEEEYKIVLFDYIGHGKSDISTYDYSRYDTLQGYADDILNICHELSLQNAVLVGHSVSAMIGMLAAIKEPSVFEKLIMVSPSPCYINDDGYTGGFSRADVESLLDSLENNYLGWSSTMAPVIMGNPDRPELGEELTNSFCRTNPDIARHFAHVTFLSDNRADLPKLKINSLILQCSQDTIAPREVGEYVHRNIADSELVVLQATGHCPHLSAPAETIAAMKCFLN